MEKKRAGGDRRTSKDHTEDEDDREEGERDEAEEQERVAWPERFAKHIIWFYDGIFNSLLWWDLVASGGGF